MIKFHELASNALDEGVSLPAITSLESRYRITKAMFIPEVEFDKEMAGIESQMMKEFQGLVK